jgi:UDP-N-acetylglucosamine:LPS N-acetylglucosamine transferase
MHSGFGTSCHLANPKFQNNHEELKCNLVDSLSLVVDATTLDRPASKFDDLSQTNLKKKKKKKKRKTVKVTGGSIRAKALKQYVMGSIENYQWYQSFGPLE